MSRLPGDEGFTKEEWEKDDLFKELQDNVYKCYKCGKTELGKNLDNLYSSSVGKKEGWLLEFERDGKIEIAQGPPSYNPRIVQCDSTKAYCDTCGKIRERELELLNLEIRKVKAFEKIASAFENSDNMVITLKNIGTALKALSDIADELRHFRHSS